MLHITYAPDDVDIAERMKNDLSAANLTVEQNILIVLITPESAQDKSVNRAISEAIENDHIVLPVMLRTAPLPSQISHITPIDLTKGYQFSKIIKAVRSATIGQDVLTSNRRLLFYLMALVLLIFGISVGSLATGLVAVPEEELANEQATRDAQISTLTFPTLDPLMPRTTQDALDFPLTVEAANTRNAPLLMATATAIVENQQATESARAATQTAVAGD